MKYLEKRIKMICIFLSLGLFITIEYVYPHEFTSDEISLFLKTIDEIRAQGDLIQISILNNDTNSLSQYTQKLKQLYSENMKKEIAEKNERVSNNVSTAIADLVKSELNTSDVKENILSLNNILDEAISIRIPQYSENNSTIQALRFAELIKEVDKNYAKTLNEKQMNMSSMKHMTDNKMNMTTSMTMSTSESNKSSIADPVSYNTSKRLLLAAQTVYDLRLREADLATNDTEKLNNLSSGLEKLSLTVEEKKPYLEVVKIIHGTIQPVLGEIFNLKIAQSSTAMMNELKQYKIK